MFHFFTRKQIHYSDLSLPAVVVSTWVVVPMAVVVVVTMRGWRVDDTEPNGVTIVAVASPVETARQ